MNRALVAAGAAALALILVFVGDAWIGASLPDVASLARRTPARTAMMRQRAGEARAAGRPTRIDQRWMPYDRISPLLRAAVLIAEDDAFFSHGGLDWGEMRASVRRNVEEGRIVRGGSTITQQLARNLYLGNQRTLTRKLSEVLLARRLEGALTKRRIFELYLNLIEWGDGVYGIEAAAETRFGVSASRLDPRQAALLAAVIINPRRYDPAHPDRRIEGRARMILTRMRRRGLISEDEYLAATGRAPRPWFLRWLFGGHSDSAPPPEPGLAPESAPPPPEADSTAAAPDTLPD
jgi:monofunctional biosynthetic peptidoglycan transglycosylase